MARLQPAINLIAALLYDDALPPQNNQGLAQGAPPGPGAQVPQAQAQDPLAAQMRADQVAALPPATGAAGGNFQAPMCYRTFASLFADPAVDPNYERASEIVTRFDPANAAPLTAVALKQSLLGQLTPYTYLCCASLNDNAPKVNVVHSLSRYPMSLAGQLTPWDDGIVGY